jgi:hypothetical protein
MPDRPLPVPANPLEAQTAFEAHKDKALAGLCWEQDGPLAILVWLEARRPSGEVDEYLARLSFLHYPEWPPAVTFVNPDTKRYDPAFWPRTSSDRMAMHPTYGDGSEGLVCNSMVFQYYFWGGHQATDTTRWAPGNHTFAATLNELVIHLQPPSYQGRA